MRRALTVSTVLLVIAVAIGALGTLLDLRLTSGDVYPPYSSLRADPLGSKALYDSLASIPGLHASRHTRHPRHLPIGPKTGLWVIGLPGWELNGSREEAEVLDRFTKAGGRLVITLEASGLQSWRMTSQLAGTNAMPRTNSPPSKKPFDSEPSGEELVDFQKQWGFKFQLDYSMRTNGTPASFLAQCVSSNLSSPALPWHSSGYFVPTHPEWRPIAHHGSNIVMMERTLGSGTIVIASDSFLLSNEALRHARASEFLSWLIGDSTTLLFNETHHGIQDNPGVSTLIRRYRLGFLFAALAGLAALFIWQGSLSFVPQVSATSADASSAYGAPVLRGRDAVAGLVGLLRRSIRPQQLMSRCLQEWNRSKHGDRYLSAERLRAIQELIDQENARSFTQKNPVSLYAQIVSTLRLSRAPASKSQEPKP